MSVLSHELAHITQKHISRMYGNRKESSALMMAAAILSAVAVSSSNTNAALGLITLGQGAALQNKLIFCKYPNFRFGYITSDISIDDQSASKNITEVEDSIITPFAIK